MNPPIKKLAAIFLLIAVFTSSLALGVSAFLNRGQAAKGAAQAGGAGYNNPYGGPAFVDTGGTYGVGPNGQNLTEEVTDIFARELVATNPQGPQTQDGLIRLLSPTGTELAAYLQMTSPRTDLLTTFDESKIQVVEDFTPSDITRYVSAIIQVQSDLIANPVWQAGLNVTVTDLGVTDGGGWASESERALSEARDALYAIKAPAPFLALHKSVLASLATAASFTGIVIQDPVGALALSNELDAVVAKQIAAMDQAVKDLQKNLPEYLAGVPPGERPMLAKLLRIQIAHATVPTYDYVNFIQWLKDFWDDYKEDIQSYALGFLKNVIVQKLGQKVIEWAQGEGVPGYVTNWLIFEADMALGAQFGLISERTAKLCGNAATEGLYGDILSSALGAPSTYRPPGKRAGDAVNCPPRLFDPSRGGRAGFSETGEFEWDNFLNSIQYNVWNDVLTVRDSAIAAGAAASQAAVHEALSGRGSLDVKKCDDGTAVDNEGLCADGSPARTITPGSAKQELLSKVLAAPVDIITAVNNPNMYSAIVQVLTNAVLTFVLQKGEGFFSGSGRGSSGPPTPPPADSSLTERLTWYESQLEIALDLTNGTVAIYDQAIISLQNALNYCEGEVAAKIQDLLDPDDGFPSIVAEFKTQAENIQGRLDTVRQFQENPAAHTQSELESRVGTAAAITTLVTQAKSDNAQAQQDTTDANALFLSCPAP